MDSKTVIDEIKEDVNQSLTMPGVDRVSVKDLFPDPFIAGNTEFDSLGSLVDAYCESSESEHPLDPELDDFIQSHTDFGSWNNMRQQAEIKYMEEHLA